MLSILIPTYNYNVYPLVCELKKQAEQLTIAFEILVQDDASTLFLSENEAINSLKNCLYFLNSENLGRGNNINTLNSKAKFDYVLLLEADAFPETENYLEILIKTITPKTEAVFGGVGYPTIKPEKNKLLRWFYGNERESISLQKRLENPFHFVFTWNLLLKKEILIKNPFPKFVKEYGYEDVVFINQLKNQHCSIEHIQNRLIHHNQEENMVFIKKTEKAIQTLKMLLDNGKISTFDTKIGRVFSKIKILGLTNFFAFLFRLFEKRMMVNLDSAKPNLKVLDCYKLGYLCSLYSAQRKR